MIFIDFIDKLAQSMDAPEVIPGISKITIVSDTAVVVENYDGVCEYTNELIYIRLKKKMLEICGSELNIEYLSENTASISGKIHSVGFV